MRVSLLRRGVRVPRYTLIKRTKTSGGGPQKAGWRGGGNDIGIHDGDEGVGTRTVENRCWIIWRKTNVCLFAVGKKGWRDDLENQSLVGGCCCCWGKCMLKDGMSEAIWRKLIQLLVGNHWWKDGGGMLNMIGMDFVWKINTIVKREGRGGRLRYNYLWNNHYLWERTKRNETK